MTRQELKELLVRYIDTYKNREEGYIKDQLEMAKMHLQAEFGLSYDEIKKAQEKLNNE